MVFLTEKSLNKKILEIMQADPRCQYTATVLDRLFYKEESKEYVKKKRSKEIQKIRTELSRLLSREEIVKHRRGYYSLKITPATLRFLENPPITVHGLKLECQSKQTVQKSILRITANNNKNYTKEMLDWFKAMSFKESTNYRWFKRIPWEGRGLEVTVHLNGLIEIWLKSSELPLSYPDMVRLCSYLNGFLSTIKPEDIMVRQIGVAKDFQSLRMDGVSSITLHKFMNDWSKIYYKETIGAVRIERHLTVNLSLEQAMNTLFLLNSPSMTNGNGHGEDSFEDVV